MPLVLFEDDDMWEKNNFFVAQAAQRGVYLHPWHNMFVCAAHTEEVVNQALARTEGAFAALKQQFG
jgi:glutamate-1-semialdehyde 2,1-aminomutase